MHSGRSLVCIAVTLFLTLMFARLDFGQSLVGSFKGKIEGQNPFSVDGLQIKLMAYSGTGTPLKTAFDAKSDASGSFSISRVPFGKYIVAIFPPNSPTPLKKTPIEITAANPDQDLKVSFGRSAYFRVVIKDREKQKGEVLLDGASYGQDSLGKSLFTFIGTHKVAAKVTAVSGGCKRPEERVESFPPHDENSPKIVKLNCLE